MYFFVVRYWPRRLSLCGIIVVIVFLSLWFGQVLGGFYLGTVQSHPADGERPVKRKVLRLEKIPYYCLQLAVYNDYEQATACGKALAEKGYPPLISGTKPYQVVLGFSDRKESLQSLADTIIVEGKKGILLKKEVNEVAFKFAADDSYAAAAIAPLLGDLSAAFEEALLIMGQGWPAVQDGDTINRFTLLAGKLETLAQAEGSLEPAETTLYPGMARLLQQCGKWASTIRTLLNDGGEYHFLLCQQQGLATLEEYHRVLAATN